MDILRMSSNLIRCLLSGLRPMIGYFTHGVIIDVRENMYIDPRLDGLIVIAFGDGDYITTLKMMEFYLDEYNTTTDRTRLIVHGANRVSYHGDCDGITMVQPNVELRDLIANRSDPTDIYVVKFPEVKIIVDWTHHVFRKYEEYEI